MPDRSNEFILPRRFGYSPSKDGVLILTDEDPDILLSAKDNLHRDGRDFYHVMGDVYLANSEIIKKHLRFFKQKGIDFFIGWETNTDYKSKLSKGVLEDRCYIVDTSQENLYKPAKKGKDYEIIYPYTPNLDLIPLDSIESP